MIRIAVFDEKESERYVLMEALNRFFSRCDREITIIEYSNANTLLADVSEEYEHFDLVFLEINQEGTTGLDTAHELRNMKQQMPIIFVAETSVFAMEGYEVQAFAYLLKPLDERKLDGTLKRLYQAECRHRVAFRCKGGVHRYFSLDEIVWVESEKHKAIFHFEDNTAVSINDKLSCVEETLNDSRFLRCHQSFLVNMDYITDVQDDFIIRDGSRVPIRVRSHKAIVDEYHRYFSLQEKTARNGV